MKFRLFLPLLVCAAVVAFYTESYAFLQTREGGSIRDAKSEESLPEYVPQAGEAPVDSAVSLEPSIPLDESDDGKIVSPTAVPTPESGVTFLSLNYHNVEDNDPDQTFVGVTTSRLVDQLSWMKYNGYHAVSIDDILAAKAGKKPLPDKAVLITFDDGYISFYTRVFPIFKAFKWPVLFAVVDKWLEGGRPDDTVEYGDYKMPRSSFVTWDEIREMDKSGLVEIASHTHNLHRGILANPQGNTEPAVVTHQYFPQTHTYESEAAYEARLNADAAFSAKKIQQEIGHRPRVVVWPYGQYNQTAVRIFSEHGMPITLTLDDGFGTIKNLSAVPRYLINADPNMEGFVVEMRDLQKPNPIRAVHIDLDYVYDKDPKQEAKNLDALIARVYNMKINTVFLQAFADPEGDGFVKQLYFPNRHLPMRQDLFNRVAWQLATRANVKVYAWMPVLSYELPNRMPVLAWDPKTGKAGPDPKAYHRVSLFDEHARRDIADIYEDLARYAPIDGILFHDDAMMSDYEDASPPALAEYKKAGLPASIEAIRANPQYMKKWTDFKISKLISFTNQLSAHARKYRTPLLTARNIYAPVVMTPQSREWFAQDFDKCLQAYDYTAVEAMPYMENVPSGHANDWLQQLEAAVAKHHDGLKHTIFELQAVDWRKNEKDSDRQIPTKTLAAQMRLLERLGALNIAYYPDDFLGDHPVEKELHKDFSIQSYPYSQ